ncbi:MAG: hypothetical protein AAF160_16170, partial [Pseudomonadota bacterium]
MTTTTRSRRLAAIGFLGTVRNFVCGPWVEHFQPAILKRSSKRIANWAFAMPHSLGGILHSFSA